MKGAASTTRHGEPQAARRGKKDLDHTATELAQQRDVQREARNDCCWYAQMRVQWLMVTLRGGY